MKKVLIIGSVVVIILLVTVLIVSKRKASPVSNSAVGKTDQAGNSSASKSPSNDYGNQNVEPDVKEGAPLTSPEPPQNPNFTWTKKLPYRSQYYDIYYNPPYDITIDLPTSFSPAIKDRYQQEALDWLKAQSAPMDQINVNVLR
ncbi:MAG: hypothetical protein JWO40_579 [Candidatus Doudnabacteria bacterium]|nr:hypothetical protein [Candidatus Doudnabacteria bacterium]